MNGRLSRMQHLEQFSLRNKFVNNISYSSLTRKKRKSQRIGNRALKSPIAKHDKSDNLFDKQKHW